jgi:hypothetical protein
MGRPPGFMGLAIMSYLHGQAQYRRAQPVVAIE